MDRIDKLTIRAKELSEPKLKPYELAMRKNPYIGRQTSRRRKKVLEWSGLTYQLGELESFKAAVKSM